MTPVVEAGNPGGITDEEDGQSMVFLWIFAAVVVGVSVLLVGWNLLRLRTGRIASAVPDAIRREILAEIDRAGTEDGARVLLLRVVASGVSDAYSKLGGTPLYPTGTTNSGSARHDSRDFLAQVRLRSPPLAAAWSDVVVMLFWDAAGGVIASNSGFASSTDTAAVPGGNEKERGIEPVRLPPGDIVDNEESDAWPSSPYDPRSLLRRVPTVRGLLANYPDAPERLLPHILVPGVGTHEIETFHVSLMGGEPELIQGDHDAACPRCAKSMEFLFQIGDVLELGGDAPIVYVYGCREHPSELQAFVDMH